MKATKLGFPVFLSVCLLSLLIASCGGSGGGGGGNDDDDDDDNNSSGITLDTEPTATLTASQSNADDLTSEIQTSATELVALSSSPIAPAAVNLLPAGVTTTIQCSSLGADGSGSYTIESNITGEIVAGSEITVTYNDCSYTISGATITYSGSYVTEYTRWTDETDFAFSISYDDFSTAYASDALSYTYGPLNGSYNYDVADGAVTFYYSLASGGASDITAADVVRDGDAVTITSATYIYESEIEDGVVSVVFDNWTYDTVTGNPVSGTITITGADGNSVQMEAGATAYTVTYIIAAAEVAYTVPYSD